ncbi:MAG: GDP-mannose 4,6-dehydratase [Candidatus Omnitrophica bacterium]|nr:GDP-mannose 4,6-dehydratase [Candidatus Omnitrophota bacterium]MBU1869074.1 GDP-mannose 4,6-dehydratase [Candidatus Omnitrophota bacterium]
MKILITGGAGFIGSHLAGELLKKGCSVVALDDLSTGKLENVKHLKEHAGFSIKVDSIMNEKLMGKLVKESDAVYHLAAAVGVKYVIDNPLKSIETNVRGTEIALGLASKYDKPILIASTSEVYGKNCKVPFKEEDDSVIGYTKLYRWSYACTKKLDEFLAFAYFKEKKNPVVITRFFNTCGERQTGEYGMVVPRFVKQAILNQPITIFGDGKQKRCFSYVGDVVRGVIALMNTPKCYGEVFNIGNDKEISIEELAHKIKEMTNSKSPIHYISYQDAYGDGFEDMQRRVPNLSKIKKFIGYSPKVNLKEMLELIIKDFKA